MMGYVLFCCCFIFCLLDSVCPLLIGISPTECLGDISMSRQGVPLPEWHQTRVLESINEPGEETARGESIALVIDTLGAFVDSISLTLLGDKGCSEVVVMVYDGDACIWSGNLMFPHTNNSVPLAQSQRTIDLLDGIRAPVADKVKLIDSFPYDGDFVALWRVRYLFDLVDEFIIVEAAKTYSGLKKTTLFFLEPENAALFAPYMSKITYVVVQEFPPPPAYWRGLMEGHMFDWEHEWPGFWRENYQKIFCRFFVRPPSKTGKIRLIFVSDADEILNAETMKSLLLAEETRLSEETSLFMTGKVVHPQMYCFYYNFNTVSMNAWERPFLVSSETYESLKDTLYVRVAQGNEAVLVPNGGWHLTYFTSYPGFHSKLANMAHLTIVNTSLLCEEIRDAISLSKDLFGRSVSFLAARHSLAGVPAALMPPWWAELQAELEEMQAATCECC